MLDAFVNLEMHILIAGILERLVHVAGELGRHEIVAVAVENADGHVLQDRGLRRVGATANRNRGREEVRTTGDGVPGAVAAHGETGDVDAVGIGVKFFDLRFDHVRDEASGLGGQGLESRLRAAAMQRSPELGGRALAGDEHDLLLLVADVLHDVGHAEFVLGEVVVAAFADAVQEDEDRRLAGLFLVVKVLADVQLVFTFREGLLFQFGFLEDLLPFFGLALLLVALLRSAARELGVGLACRDGANRDRDHSDGAFHFVVLLFVLFGVVGLVIMVKGTSFLSRTRAACAHTSPFLQLI